MYLCLVKKNCLNWLISKIVLPLSKIIAMDTLVALHNKIEALPSNMRSEALLFIDFLIEKSGRYTQKIERKFGSVKGKIHMSEDFDEPLEDLFKEYM